MSMGFRPIGPSAINRYSVDIEKMEQKNIKTGFTRKVIPCCTFDIPLPISCFVALGKLAIYRPEFELRCVDTSKITVTRTRVWRLWHLRYQCGHKQHHRTFPNVTNALAPLCRQIFLLQVQPTKKQKTKASAQTATSSHFYACTVSISHS